MMSAHGLKRRGLLGAAGGLGIAVGAGALGFPTPLRAQRPQLRIAQWKHFVPAFDHWFNQEFAREWGQRNDIDVVVDNIGFGDLRRLAAEEIGAKHGHDLFQFVTPAAAYEDEVIDHREIWEEGERRHGKAAGFASKACLNPKTGKHVGIVVAYQPAVVSYRKAMWDGVGFSPGTWADVLAGGRRIKLLMDKPVGLSLAAEHNSNQTWRAMMYSFGASEQDASGRLAMKSKEMLDALAYAKDLYEQAMTPEVLAWDGASNNRFMLDGEGCLTLDSLSIARASEAMKLPLDDLALADVPTGPDGRFSPSFGFYTYVIWKFAANAGAAAQFLVDAIGASRTAFIASGLQNMPSFPDTVPDLAALAGEPSSRYGVLVDVPASTVNIGHPGHTGPAVGEIYDRSLIPRMFANAATGRLSPAEALDEADREARQIVERWSAFGKG